VIKAVESTEGKVTVHVRWWDAGPIRRLRPDGDVWVDSPAGPYEIPPNPCVSDLLFGAKLYAMRAHFLRNEVDLATGKIPDDPSSTDTASTGSVAPPPVPSATTSAAPSTSASTTAAPSTSASATK
jgi:hypothetical protein